MKSKKNGMTLKTAFQKRKEKRDAMIYAEYSELAANPENSKIAISEHLMRKYKIRSRATIWAICKQLGERYYGDDDSRAE